MGTLAAGIKDIFSTAKTTGTNVMLCGNDGTPDGHMTLNNLKNSILTFDTTPTANSNNPVTSGGIKAYVDKYPALDIPMPFENEDVKAVVVNAFGGLLGGQNHDIPGFRGEITYRQARSVTNINHLFFRNATSGSFNEFKFFVNCRSDVLAFHGSGINSIIFPEGFTSLSNQAIRGAGSRVSCYVELPSTITKIGELNFHESSFVVKLWATTPPSIADANNTAVSKVLVPQSALSAYQADAQWSQYGSKLEGF